VLRNKLYYGIKPLIPRKLRMAVRSWFTSRKRGKVGDVWPIFPGSDRPPEGWPGWPGGKKFAFVLTHDVEGQSGVDKCARLMRLEASLGFRSSFNFIPEGTYRVPLELRRELTANGFEVGVHDLNHDGKLYSSRSTFTAKARRINDHLREWDAVGFRSGFMLHNLDWLGDLEVAYDASTFDTDPFEPQPDCAGTIFPFWVPRGSDSSGSDFSSPARPGRTRGGYVELPYTLPQDSTLFLLLGERHVETWLKKLDWVASRGGMVLVNVHPDYIEMDAQFAGKAAFPVEFYGRLLRYVRDKYGDTYWQPLPREVAAYVAQFKPRLRPKPRRICMVTHSDYTVDARVTRYAEALAERGDHVDVLALGASPDLPRQETIRGVNLYRLYARGRKDQQTRMAYLLPILRFFGSAALWVAKSHFRKPYDLLHVHNVPDFLVFTALFPKLTGAKVILDIHDILPEFYASKFAAAEGKMSVKLLKSAEWASAKVADHVIIANDLWIEKYVARTGARGRCSVFINNVDGNVFAPRPRVREDGAFIIIFPGGLQWHQGLDIAIRAFKKVVAELPPAEFHIYGEGNMKVEWMALAQELGLGEKIKFFKPRPVRQIADIMANADLGVVPKRADSFGNEAYSTKIMEFMSLGVPVVASSTRIDRHYFDETLLRFFESGNVDALAAAIIEVARDGTLRRRLVANASRYALRHGWESRKTDYLRLVDSVIDRRARTTKESPVRSEGIPDEQVEPATPDSAREPVIP
jgi:glycosyltransferase involved in cell wall biosynthesis